MTLDDAVLTNGEAHVTKHAVSLGDEQRDVGVPEQCRQLLDQYMYC